MSAQVTITQLPAAGAITGTEAVPIVQNGQTVQTTTAALAGSPVQTQTFITKNQEPTLANSRALSNGTGVGLVDGGAQSTLQITLNAASGSLEAASNGMIAKTASNAVVARTMTSSTAGLSVTNGDGVAGAPAFALTGVALAVAGATGTGALALTSPTTVSTRTILGTANQIDVTDGNFVNSPVIAIASNPTVPGSGGIVLPAGTTGQRGASTNGTIRYNTTIGLLEGYINGAWATLASGGSGVTSIATGTGLTGGPIASTGTVSLADTAVTPGAYTSANITVDQQGRITSAANGAAGGVTSFSAGTTGFTPSTASTGAITLAGTLANTNGGTGATSAFTQYGITYASSATVLATTAAGTSTTVLHGNASGAPTFGAVSLTADVTGNLPVTNLNSGTSASATTFWRGDGVWSTPAGAGDVSGPASATDNAITRFDGTTGKIIQNSLVTVADDGAIVAPSVGSIIPFYFSSTLPAAGPYHGAVAHLHSTGKLYYAHNSAWQIITSGLGTASTTGAVTPVGSAGQLLTNDGAGGLTSNTTGTGVVTALGVNVGTSGAFVPQSGSLTQYGVIYAPTTTTLATTAAGTAGHVLTANAGSAPTFQAPAGGVTTFSAGTTGLTPATATGGAVTLAGTLAVLNGGTGATNATDARTNLVAAKSGTNSDITELYALNGTSYGVAYQNAGNQLTMGSALTFNGSMLFVPGGISGGTF